MISLLPPATLDRNNFAAMELVPIMGLISDFGESIEYWFALADRLPAEQRQNALHIAEGLVVLALKVNAVMQRNDVEAQPVPVLLARMPNHELLLH